MIIVPLEGKSLGISRDNKLLAVMEDNNSIVVNFQVPMTINGIDISGYSIAVTWRNSAKVGDTFVFRVDDSTRVDGDNIINCFWAITRTTTYYPGTLTVELLITSGGEAPDYVFKSQPSNFIIAESIAFGAEPPTELESLSAQVASSLADMKTATDGTVEINNTLLELLEDITEIVQGVRG